MKTEYVDQCYSIILLKHSQVPVFPIWVAQLIYHITAQLENVLKISQVVQAQANVQSLSVSIFFQCNDFMSIAFRCKNFDCVVDLTDCDRPFSTYAALQIDVTIDPYQD